jgi:putative hydrolase of the HAD superfamily
VIGAVTLDLDDTLWPIAPAMARAEQALDDWLALNCPRVRESFPIPAMRSLRERVWLEHPHLAHDFTELRKISLRHAFNASGHDETLVEDAFDVFFHARNQVELYEDVPDALAHLARRWPLASISNGNADLERIGLSRHFRATIHARAVGAAKPDPAIFHAAARALALAPGQVAHVGDDPELDVVGAQRAGMISVWLNRGDAPWPLATRGPDLTVTRLDQLADALDALAGVEHAA